MNKDSPEIWVQLVFEFEEDRVAEARRTMYKLIPRSGVCGAPIKPIWSNPDYYKEDHKPLPR